MLTLFSTMNVIYPACKYLETEAKFPSTGFIFAPPDLKRSGDSFIDILPFVVRLIVLKGEIVNRELYII